jgi:hypothetical protein
VINRLQCIQTAITETEQQEKQHYHTRQGESEKDSKEIQHSKECSNNKNKQRATKIVIKHIE